VQAVFADPPRVPCTAWKRAFMVGRVLLFACMLWCVPFGVAMHSAVATALVAQLMWQRSVTRALRG
jgi:hypothetical protein